MSGSSRKDLKAAVTDDSVSLSNCLRQAKLLAFSLRNEVFKTWVDHELNGYPRDAEVPDYRQIAVPAFGTFWGSTAIISNQILPLSKFPEELRRKLKNIPHRNPIGEIESLASGGAEDLRCTWPAEMVKLAREFVKASGDYVLVDAWWPLPAHALQGIVEAVRNRLLDFILEIERLDPDVLTSPTAANSLPVEKSTFIFLNSIGGGQNTVALGNKTGVAQMAGDRYSAGQAGAIGPRAHAHDMVFQQLWTKVNEEVDLKSLAQELSALRQEMRQRSSSASHDIAVGHVATAETAADQGDGPGAMRSLKKAGTWALDIASKVGANLATTAIKAALGLTG